MKLDYPWELEFDDGIYYLLHNRYIVCKYSKKRPSDDVIGGDIRAYLEGIRPRRSARYGPLCMFMNNHLR